LRQHVREENQTGNASKPLKLLGKIWDMWL
jgi:hypothetical protein